MLSFFCGGLYLLLLLFKVASARWYRKQHFEVNHNIPLKQVSILQPILSGDPLLPSSLASNLETLAGAKFYWLIDDQGKAAQHIVRTLIANYKHANISMFSFPEAPEGVNPKLFKLNGALDQCHTPYCVVLDDDTTLPRVTLQALVSQLEHYQLATGLPQYREGQSFYSRLLAAFVNNNAANTYLSLLPYMAPITINGMCYAFKREYLQNLGGFAPLLHCLTDDLAVAEQVISRGGRIKQIPLKQFIATSLLTLPQYLQQMHRWYVFANILFFKQTVKKQCIIFSLYGLTPLLFISTLVLVLANISPASVLFLLAILSIRHLTLETKPRGLSGSLISLFSEYLQTCHLIHALCSKKIRWRSRWYRVNANSTFSKQKRK